MLEKILKSVTEAEAKADAMIREAEESGKQIVEEARKQAAALKESTINELKIHQQEQSKRMQEMSRNKLEEAVCTAEQEAQDLKASVDEKKKAAIEAVIERMI